MKRDSGLTIGLLLVAIVQCLVLLHEIDKTNSLTERVTQLEGQMKQQAARPYTLSVKCYPQTSEKTVVRYALPPLPKE